MTNPYTMRISRLTVDKLGVKLYDRVSAVIAELIANSYDADASEVTVEAPMGKYLATKAGDEIVDRGLRIVVTDNGIGMTPEQMQRFYLVVGGERRDDPERGGDEPTPKFGRKVMGRKGVGKLAPFGIGNIIEVISSGGEWVRDLDAANEGFRTAHIVMDYRDIVADDTEDDCPPRAGEYDQELRPATGTTVILRMFNRRQVPDTKTLGPVHIGAKMCQSGDGWRRGPGDQMTYQTKLSDAQYARLERLLPPPGNHLKIPHRQVLDAWLYVYYQGCTWRGLPREFGNWHTIYVRLNRWAKAGVLERVVQALQQELLVESDADTLSLDSTIIHLHMHGTGARRKGGGKRSAALGAA